MGIRDKFLRDATGQFVSAVHADSIPEIVRREDLLDLCDSREAFLRTITPAFFHFMEPMLNKTGSSESLRHLLKVSDLRSASSMYPLARAMKRKVFLHVGPTNSGKTHRALERLKSAKSGIYLAPLRLLAHEVFTTLNSAQPEAVPTSLVTGELRIDTPKARVIAATVEMAPLKNVNFDVAVVDEYQMICDSDRGWAWTAAVLGLQASEIHLCGDESAVDVVRELCATLGDEVIVSRHTRLSELRVAESSLHGDLSRVKRGDCIVVFSRARIYQMKRSIERATHLRCAVVYGALPPETRVAQAQGFNRGDYDVIVASDAVGMGLNLNIKRVVFSSSLKFNGKQNVRLSISQTKQIAGRAGRYASEHDFGEVTCLYEHDMTYLREALAASVPAVNKMGLTMSSEQFVEFARLLPNADVVRVLETFEDVAKTEGEFFLCNFASQKEIADALQDVKLSLEDRYIFMIAPIPTDAMSLRIFRRLARSHVDGSPLAPKHVLDLPATVPRDVGELYIWETLNKVAVAYLWLSYRFVDTFPHRNLVMMYKEITERVILEGIERLVESNDAFPTAAMADANMDNVSTEAAIGESIESRGKGKKRKPAMGEETDKSVESSLDERVDGKAAGKVSFKPSKKKLGEDICTFLKRVDAKLAGNVVIDEETKRVIVLAGTPVGVRY